MGLSFFNAERQRKKAINDSLLVSNEEPTSPSLRGDEVGEELKEEVKPKKKRAK